MHYIIIIMNTFSVPNYRVEDLRIITGQMIKNYRWTIHHSREVAQEYVKFLELRAENPKLSPCDEIDKFWHQHILNTKHYNDFCIKYYKQFIHHDPEDANDQGSRMSRLWNTINEYYNKFQSAPTSYIWTPIKTSKAIPTPVSKGPQTEVKIIYVFNNSTCQEPYKPRDNSGLEYDNKIIQYSQDLLIENVRHDIANLTGHDWYAIDIYKSYEDYDRDQKMSIADKILINKPIMLDSNAKLNTLPKSLIAILKEVSHRGFC